jgi:hypothetical protein
LSARSDLFRRMLDAVIDRLPHVISRPLIETADYFEIMPSTALCLMIIMIVCLIIIYLDYKDRRRKS